jgi:WD40 repeat protein
MSQDQDGGVTANDIIRVDAAYSYKDRNSTMWAASLLYKKGLMGLVWPEGGDPYVMFADDQVTYFLEPLGDVQYLGDAPPALGSKWLAHSAIRVAFGDERRIIYFTGDMSEYDEMRQETATAQITGDFDPAMIGKAIRGFGRIPEIRREQRDAKAAWIEILTDTRRQWLTQSQVATTEPEATFDRAVYRGLVPSGPAPHQSSESAPAGAELGFRHEYEGSWVTSVAISPDGKQVATANSDSTARLWQWESGVEQHILHHTPGARTNDVTFSFDGSLIATASEDGTARLWDTVSGKEEAQRLTHPDTVNRIAFSPDGQTLVTACEDGLARLWNVSTGEQIQQLGIDYGNLGYILTGEQIEQAGIDLFSDIIAFAFDSKGEVLAIADYGDILQWDLATASQVGELSTLEGLQALITDLAISPAGSVLAVADSRGIATLWGGSAAEPVQEFRHADEINALCFSPDGSWLATGSRDETVRLWDCRAGTELLSISHDGQVRGLAVSDDGLVLVTGGEPGVLVWRLNPWHAGNRLAGWRSDIMTLCSVAYG